MRTRLPATSWALNCICWLPFMVTLRSAETPRSLDTRASISEPDHRRYGLRSIPERWHGNCRKRTTRCALRVAVVHPGEFSYVATGLVAMEKSCTFKHPRRLLNFASVH